MICYAWSALFTPFIVAFQERWRCHSTVCKYPWHFFVFYSCQFNNSCELDPWDKLPMCLSLKLKNWLQARVDSMTFFLKPPVLCFDTNLATGRDKMKRKSVCFWSSSMRVVFPNKPWIEKQLITRLLKFLKKNVNKMGRSHCPSIPCLSDTADFYCLFFPRDQFGPYLWGL